MRGAHGFTLLAALAAAPMLTQARPDDLGAALGQAIAAIRIPADGATAHGLSRTALRRLYASSPLDSAPRPLWTSGGRPTPQAAQAVAVLGSSDVRGLRPADYDAAGLREQLAVLARPGAPTDADLARFDVGLSLSLMRMVAHLHAGRVNPHALRFHLPETHGGLDLAGIVRTMTQAPDVAASVGAAEPPYAGYRALAGALARYRKIAETPELRPPDAREVMRPGDRYPEAAVLARYLATLGDLPRERAGAAADSAATYDSALASGVAAFQRRHGLEPDGVLGPATRAQLAIPAAQRARQLELAMERWRWLPDVAPDRLVVVNVPAFRLYAFERAGTGMRRVLGMNVIVGEAERRRFTPLFVGTMREVVLHPYWDVPPSIARGELLPKIRQRPGYLQQEELEVVRGGDHDAVVYAPTAANLARVASGDLRLRQRPGAKNALGAVKFVFPNEYNVYLHGTPAQELFARPRRDFSHGCIRVEDPSALAEWMLAGPDGWDPPTIAAAMSGVERSRRVPVARPVSVYVLYVTAVVADDGNVRFYPDLYGHDEALARSLHR